MRPFLPLFFLKTKIKNTTAVRCYAKEIKFGNDGKSLLLKGAETLANVVSVTLGPKAGNVIVDSRFPKITKDGAFVANSIVLDDNYENIGVQIMKKMAEATNKEASNGTKSATVLAREIAREGYKRIIKGSNPVEIRRGIMDAAEVANNYLDEISRKVETEEEIEKVSTIFAGGDQNLGKIVSDAFILVGKDGMITVKESEEMSSENAEVSRGMILESGIFMSNFPLDSSGRIKLENVLLLIYDKKIEELRTIIPLLEVAVSKHKPLVIIAEDFTMNIGVTLAVNNESVIGIKFAAVKIPGDKDFNRDILKDLAFASGCKVYGDEGCGKKANKIDESYFGEIPEMLLTKSEMVCIHGNSELLMEKVANLKEEIETAEDEEEKAELKERLARLESNIAIISIDGTDKEEAKKKKERIYSIIESTKVAMEEGILPGAGVALIRCAAAVTSIDSPSEDHKLGVKILANSLSAPFCTIVSNSHESPAPILHKIKNLPPYIGYDVISQSYVDAFETGIVDPTKAIKSALKNAANTASLMVNAEAVVVYKFDGTELIL